MRFFIVFVAVVTLFLFVVQEAHSQNKATIRRESVPPPEHSNCSGGDLPNGYRKPKTNLETVFTVVEQQPEFPGGTKALSAFLKVNVRSPDEARKAGVSGRVYVSFIIERDGLLSAIYILKGLGFGCDEEALRVMALMPRWEPGKQAGVALRVKYNMPIAFGLD